MIVPQGFIEIQEPTEIGRYVHRILVDEDYEKMICLIKNMEDILSMRDVCPDMMKYAIQYSEHLVRHPSTIILQQGEEEGLTPTNYDKNCMYCIECMKKSGGYIYLLELNNNVHKLGRTNNYHQRLEHYIKTFTEVKVLSIYKVGQYIALEKLLILAFTPQRIIPNEWLALSEDDIKKFNKLVVGWAEKYGGERIV